MITCLICGQKVKEDPEARARHASECTIVSRLCAEVLDLTAKLEQTKVEQSIPMFLTCPRCGARHIDEGQFATKIHATHSCQTCGLTWRPAIQPTVGVKFLPGFRNVEGDEGFSDGPIAPIRVVSTEVPMKKYQASVVSGFPGVGKSTFAQSDSTLRVLDSDSSKFSWQDPVKKIRHPEWPSNYIRHIQENLHNGTDIILVSSHAEVRSALVKAEIPFVLVYPDEGMKDEYIQRYVSRGNDGPFVDLLRNNFKIWICELKLQTGCTHVPLRSGQYLTDVLFL